MSLSVDALGQIAQAGPAQVPLGRGFFDLLL